MSPNKGRLKVVHDQGSFPALRSKHCPEKLPVDLTVPLVPAGDVKSESSLLTRRIERETPRMKLVKTCGQVLELCEMRRFTNRLRDNKVFDLCWSHARNTLHAQTNDVSLV